MLTVPTTHQHMSLDELGELTLDVLMHSVVELTLQTKYPHLLNGSIWSNIVQSSKLHI